MPTLPGGGELLIILFIILLLFGGKKLPGLARSIGTSMKEFRNATRNDEPAAVRELGRTDEDGSNAA